MGASHFLTKTLKRVRTEMALLMLAYSLRRLLTILAPIRLMAAIRT